MSNPKPATKKPLWRGPDVDGVTQSLLGKFLECRHRFWLKTVCGLAEDEGFSRPLEFGNLWHMAEEHHLGGKPWEAAIKQYRLKLERTYPDDTAEIYKWFSVCKTTFPIYLKYWAAHKDEAKAKPILEETSFAVPYKLPSGRTVLLRGKWDALRLLQVGKTKKLGIFTKEHKTKGEIDEDGILKTVAWNLQTMMYQIALREWCLHGGWNGNDDGLNLHPTGKTAPLLVKALNDGLKPAGVHYNVIRRPLADFRAIRQKVKETNDEFYRRLGDVITEASFTNGKPKARSDFFMRWKVEVTDEEIETFKQHTFHSILEQLMDWWEWIKVDPFDPWRPRQMEELEVHSRLCELYDTETGQIPNTFHYQSPWGVYNSLAGGFRGSFFEHLTTGRDYGLVKINTLFPEL